MLRGERRLPEVLAGLLTMVALLVACDDGAATPAPTDRIDTSASSAVPAESDAGAGTTASAPPLPSTTIAPGTTSSTPTTAAPGVFASTVEPLSDEIRRRMTGSSMRPGCPVGFDELRHVVVSRWTFEGTPSFGELVVHRDVAEDIVAVFRRLYELHYPVRRMQLVDDFGAAESASDGASDFRSIEADNTSAFNCRTRTGSSDSFSEHSYGLAIDVNPIENPYVTERGTTAHAASRPYLDRSSPAPGVILAGDAVVEAFAEIGWSWGGTWSGARDYQHFSRSGR